MSLTSVRERMAAAAAACGRTEADVRLVVVTKGRDVGVIEDVYAAGHRDFGENRAQELVAKRPLLPDDIQWHFVGPLQRNKVNKVAGTLLHSLDRPRLAAAWSPQPALVQVNVGNEPQKHGVSIDEAPDLVGEAIALGVDVRGLMTIAPRVVMPEEARPYFDALRSLRDQIAEKHPAVTELSMGMTEDFEVAIAAGATTVRIGRAIFEGAG